MIVFFFALVCGALAGIVCECAMRCWQIRDEMKRDREEHEILASALRGQKPPPCVEGDEWKHQQE